MTPPEWLNRQYRCPACGEAALFVGDGGYLACSWAQCPEPDAPHRAALSALRYTDLPRSKYQTTMEKR